MVIGHGPHARARRVSAGRGGFGQAGLGDGDGAAGAGASTLLHEELMGRFHPLGSSAESAEAAGLGAPFGGRAGAGAYRAALAALAAAEAAGVASEEEFEAGVVSAAAGMAAAGAEGGAARFFAAAAGGGGAAPGLSTEVEEAFRLLQVRGRGKRAAARCPVPFHAVGGAAASRE